MLTDLTHISHGLDDGEAEFVCGRHLRRPLALDAKLDDLRSGQVYIDHSAEHSPVQSVNLQLMP